MLRILKIFDGDYPWDVRVEKILRSLTQAGHQTTLLARNRQGRPRAERLDEVEIRRLPTARRFESLASFPAFFHPRWIRAALRTAAECRPERVFVRDLPLAPLGIWLGRRLDVPVIIDMAEPYPEALRSNWQFDRLGGLDHLTRNPGLADRVERWVVRQSPRVLVVAEEAGARLERVGLPSDRWTLVGNTPDVAATRAAASRGAPAVPEALAAAGDDARILLFTGILVGDRGVDVAIRGLARLAHEGRPVHLVVIGDGPARASYEEEARRAGVAERVHFVGWMDHDDLPPWWRTAHVGLLPFHACSHIDHTLANKLFDYMAVGLPVLGSDGRPMRRVLDQTGAGLTFRSGDAGDFARQASRLLDDEGLRKRMHEAGLRAADETYDWDRDAARLLEVVERP